MSARYQIIIGSDDIFRRMKISPPRPHAWCAYDWANSAFPTVIVTFVFSVYFVDGVAVDKITGISRATRSLPGLRLRFSARFSVRSPTCGPAKTLARFFSAMTIVCAGLLWFSILIRFAISQWFLYR